MRKILLYIMLAGIYFFIVTPIALILRLFRKKHLNTDIDSSVSTYWSHVEMDSHDKERYEHLY